LLAYNLYLDRLLGYLKSYVSTVLASGSLDGLIFSGGIGEHSAKIRQDVVETFAWIEKLARSEGGLDTEANGQSQGLRRITREGSIVPAFVVETDEELEAVELAIQAAEKTRET
jgi:acetate kinase